LNFCYGNLIYRNTFIRQWERNDPNYEKQAYDNGKNFWNSSSLGNYWNDYRERYPTATNDGETWDQAYEIEGTTPPNLDEYPLVKPTL
jgi:hypothetical protein